MHFFEQVRFARARRSADIEREITRCEYRLDRRLLFRPQTVGRYECAASAQGFVSINP